MVVNEDILKLSYNNVVKLSENTFIVSDNKNSINATSKNTVYVVLSSQEDFIKVDEGKSIQTMMCVDGATNEDSIIQVKSSGYTYLIGQSTSKIFIKAPFNGSVIFNNFGHLVIAENCDDNNPRRIIVYNFKAQEVCYTGSIISYGYAKYLAVPTRALWFDQINSDGTIERKIIFSSGIQNKQSVDNRNDAYLARIHRKMSRYGFN